MPTHPPEDGTATQDVTPKKDEFTNIKPLFRGIWAERLENNQVLPVGGSLFSQELSTGLLLDFDSFEADSSNFTEENLRALFEQSKDGLIDWLTEIGSDIDPYTYFACYQVQLKTHQLLEIDQADIDPGLERQKKYMDNESPALSSLKGVTGCAERAALGQWLIQKAGIDSAYVSGITIPDANDLDDYPEDHSWVVLRDPEVENSHLIFDIARPRAAEGNPVPRVLQTKARFNYDQLKDTNDALFMAREVLQGGELYFGVGHPASGKRNIVGSEN